jgi:lysozyme
MHMTDRGLLALVRHEGLVPGPYFDVKSVWTFGIGHTASAGPPDPAGMPRGMPADLDAGIREAFRLFRSDIVAYEAEVLRAVTVPKP